MTKAARRAALLAALLVPAATVVAGPTAPVPQAASDVHVTVKGKVVNTDDLLNPVWNEAKDPKENRFDFREPASTVPPEKRILRGHLSKELCIAVLEDSAPTPPKKQLEMIIEGGRTSPVTRVVGQGVEIKFINKDNFDHDIYEVSGKGGFGEGNMLKQGTRTWTPPGPGKYEIRDKLAPSVRSWIVVEPKVLKTVYPNRSGDFQTELDPGAYTLQAYFAGDAVGDKLPIEVKPAHPVAGGPAPEQTLDKPLKAGADKAKKDDSKKDDAKKAGG